MTDSNSISSVTLRWLPRSLLAVLNALSLSFARRRLVSPSKWNWNDIVDGRKYMHHYIKASNS